MVSKNETTAMAGERYEKDKIRQSGEEKKKKKTLDTQGLLELESPVTGIIGRFCEAICKQRPYGWFHTNKKLPTEESLSGCFQQKCVP